MKLLLDCLRRRSFQKHTAKQATVRLGEVSDTVTPFFFFELPLVDRKYFYKYSVSFLGQYTIVCAVFTKASSSSSGSEATNHRCEEEEGEEIKQ